MPQTEKFLNFVQFFGWVGDKILGTKKVKLFNREVMQPSC